MPLHFRGPFSFLSDINPAAFFRYSLSPPSSSSLFLFLFPAFSLFSLIAERQRGKSVQQTSRLARSSHFSFRRPTRFPHDSLLPLPLGDEQNLTETLFGECAFSFEFRHSDANAHVLNTNALDTTAVRIGAINMCKRAP